MSPSRSRQPFVRARPRSEVIVAAAVCAGIVLGTALLIWLMRPGPSGLPGGGGLFNRQPRMTMLGVVTLAVIGLVAAYLLTRSRRPRFGLARTIAGVVLVVVVIAFAGALLWPGGAIRHYPHAPEISNPVTPATPASASTTAPPTHATTVPSTTAKSGTSPTTVASPTTKGP